MTSKILSLASLFLILNIFSVKSFANPLEPLFGGYYSSNCDSHDSSVIMFNSNKSKEQNGYIFVIYYNKKEVFKGSGLASIDQSGLVTLVDKYFVLDDNSKNIESITHSIIRLLTNGYLIQYQADNGEVITNKGKDIYTGIVKPAKSKCSSTSNAVRSNVGTSIKLNYPEFMSESERQRVIKQKVNLVQPSKNTFNTLNSMMHSVINKVPPSESFIVAPELCEIFKKLEFAASEIIKKQPHMNDEYLIFKNTREETCNSMETMILTLEDEVQSGKKQPISECIYGKELVAKLIDGGWSFNHINRAKNISKKICKLANSK